MMKDFLIECGVIILLWFGHFALDNLNTTARFWYDAAVVVFAAKGIVWEYKDIKRTRKGEH